MEGGGVVESGGGVEGGVAVWWRVADGGGWRWGGGCGGGWRCTSVVRCDEDCFSLTVSFNNRTLLSIRCSC